MKSIRTAVSALTRRLKSPSRKGVRPAAQGAGGGGADPPHLYDTVPPKVGNAHAQQKWHPCPGHTLYLGIRQMRPQNPIDADAFVVHKSEKYVDALGDIMRENNWPGQERRRGVEQASKRIALL